MKRSDCYLSDLEKAVVEKSMEAYEELLESSRNANDVEFINLLSSTAQSIIKLMCYNVDVIRAKKLPFELVVSIVGVNSGKVMSFLVDSIKKESLL